MIFITRLISYKDYNSFSGCDVVVSAQMAPINDGDSMMTHVLGSLQTISYSTHQDKAPVRSIGNINAKDYVQGQRTIAGTMVFAMFHEHWMTPLLEELKNFVSNTDIWSDELPALNLTISMANEYGYKSNMAIYGVKFIDDGGVMSISDLYTENTLQYVATGIQPLRSSGQYEHSYNIKVSPFKISDYKPFERAWSWPGLQSYSKEWTREPYDIEFDNSVTSPLRYPFVPDIYVNEPITNTDDSVVNVYIPRDENEDNSIVNLYLSNLDDDKKYDSIYNPYNNIWTLEVPQGDYKLEIEDIYGNIIDDFDTVHVKHNDKNKIQSSCPVIIDVSDTNVRALSNDFEHDHIGVVKMISGSLDNNFVDEETDEVNIYEIATHTSIGQTNSKEILIENLEPNTKYNLYTFNSETNDKSYSITFQTFSKQDESNDILIDYVKNNADLLVTDLDKLNLKDTEFEYNNLIDSLLCLKDSPEKTELLLYAIKLQNELNRSFNETGNNKGVINSSDGPLVNIFSIEDGVKSLVVYERRNNKNYYVTKTAPKSSFQYNGKINTRYFIQPILEDNKKGIHSDFVCFSEEQKLLLSPYNKVNELSKISFINYDSRYDKYNNELRTAIKAANNLTLYKNLLPAPWARIYNDTLVVDVDYSEFVADEYYLCIATPQDALDYTPIRKISMKNKKTAALNRYNTGITKDNYYLIWMQDKNFNNISFPFIVSSYKADTDMEEFYYMQCSDRIKEIKSLLPTDSVYKTYLDNLMLNILAQDELKYKDIDYYVMQSLLNLYSDQMSQYVIDDVMINIVNAYSSECNMKVKMTYDNSSVYYSSVNPNYYISYINIKDDEIIKGTAINRYDRNIGSEGYTLIFVSNKINNYRSGYVLINNITKEIYASNIELEMIKDGR